MHAPAIPAPLTRPSASLNWKRVGAVLVISSIFGLMIGSHWKSGFVSAIGRTWTLGLVAMLTFSLFERWPPRLPRWIARWVLQVVSVAAVMPIATRRCRCGSGASRRARQPDATDCSAGLPAS